MDNETRELFRDVGDVFRSQQALNATQREIDDLTRKRLDALEHRVEVLSAAFRATHVEPGEVADAILKVVNDDND